MPQIMVNILWLFRHHLPVGIPSISDCSSSVSNYCCIRTEAGGPGEQVGRKYQICSKIRSREYNRGVLVAHHCSYRRSNKWETKREMKKKKWGTGTSAMLMFTYSRFHRKKDIGDFLFFYSRSNTMWQRDRIIRPFNHEQNDKQSILLLMPLNHCNPPH